MTMKGQQLWN